MNLDRFILEVRPTGTVLNSESIREPFDEDKCHVVSLGPQDVGVFAEVAPKLLHGSAVVFTDLNDEALEYVQSIADKTHFCRWIESPYPGFTENTKTWVRSFYNGQTFSTHLPYLLKAVELTEGPVLELGAGEGSTPALHEACKGRRLLVTVENNVEYIEKFAQLASEDHKFEHLVDPATTEWLSADKKWGVVFVDHMPGETRGRAIQLAAHSADYICVHDTEELGYGLEDLLSSFKFHKDFRYSRPWTSIVSMTKEIWT